jgi:hypothetical protein
MRFKEQNRRKHMIVDGSGGEKLLCEQLEDGSLILRRCFGSVDTVELPGELGGRPLTRIGAYCFAAQAHLSKELLSELQEAGLGDGTNPAPGLLRPVNGEYLKKLTLPDTVQGLETYAFYNCKQLEWLTVGPALREINSDAFMNCRALHTLVIRAHAGEMTGLPFLLNQLTAELTVKFHPGDDREEVCLLYPEYTESYEEIGPAHIFSLHVEGEGYRARKQFDQGRLDFAGYDRVFGKACNEEQFLTLMQMALCRLQYPYELGAEARALYQEYLSAHEIPVLRQLVRAKDETALRSLCARPEISDEAVQEAVSLAVSTGWTRGVAGIIRWRNGYAS